MSQWLMLIGSKREGDGKFYSIYIRDINNLFFFIPFVFFLWTVLGLSAQFFPNKNVRVWAEADIIEKIRSITDFEILDYYIGVTNKLCA